MEDAMILNKSAKERGFAQANVVATKLLNLDDMPGDKSRGTSGSAQSHELHAHPI